MKLLLVLFFLVSCITDQKSTNHGRRMYAKGVRNECYQSGGERDVCEKKFDDALKIFEDIK